MVRVKSKVRRKPHPWTLASAVAFLVGHDSAHDVHAEAGQEAVLLVLFVGHAAARREHMCSVQDHATTHVRQVVCRRLDQRVERIILWEKCSM